MSRREIFVCDKCGKELTGINNTQIREVSARIDLYAIGERRTCPSQRIDLCEDCFEKFVSFLEEAK